MSVKSLIATPDVRERLDDIMPPIEKLPSLPLRVPPRTAHYGLVGTAFDYALRFELQRRNQHAIARRWVAEGGLGRMQEAAGLAGFTKKQTRVLEKQGAGIIEAARIFYESYCSSSAPNVPQLTVHALLLAKLDNIYRAHVIDPELTETDPADCRDVADLLAIVPYSTLSHPKVMFLNPNFGTYSSVAGGADADLITGDLLVEVKTLKKSELKRETIRQLLVYFMLARRARTENGKYPAIQKLGIYFSRHAHLWQFPTRSITNHRRYLETEHWLIRFAAKTELAPELRGLWEMTQEDSDEGQAPKPRRGTRSKEREGLRARESQRRHR